MKKLFRRIIGCSIILAVLISILTPVYAKPFNDVDENHHEFLDAINYVSDRGIMNGTSSTAFSPNAAVTRAMVVTTLYRISGEHETGNVNPFNDISASAYYYEAVLWAYHHNIVRGMPNNCFKPNDTVTREQCLTFMYRYAEYKDLPHTHTENITGAPDYWDIHEYAEKAMSWALSYSILLRGSQGSYLYPQTNTDRKWLALYLARFRRNVECIVWTRDKFNFLNSSDHFLSGGKKRYLISDSDMSRLLNLAGSNENLKQKLINRRNCVETGTWNGSCYGMALATVLNANGKINFPGNTAKNCQELINLPSPKLISNAKHKTTQDTSTSPHTTITEVESKINMYQLSICLPSMHTWSTISSWGASQQLANMIDGHRSNGISILFYEFTSQNTGKKVQHAVVCYGKAKSTHSGYKIMIYDPRYASKNCWVEVNSTSWQGTVVTTKSDGTTAREPIIDCTYCDDFECFNSRLDFDGPQNTYYLTPRKSAAIDIFDDSEEINNHPAHMVKTDENDYISLSGKTILYVECNGPFEIETAEGQQFEYVDGEITGSLSVYGYSLMPSGESSPCAYEFIVDDSSTFTCSSLSDQSEVISFFAYNDNQFVANETVCVIVN